MPAVALVSIDGLSAALPGRSRRARARPAWPGRARGARGRAASGLSHRDLALPLDALDRGRAGAPWDPLAATPGVGEVLEPGTFGALGLPRPEHDATQGDLLLHAAEGWFFTGHATPERAATARDQRGIHGHRADDRRLHAGFAAAGPSTLAGARTEVLDQRDVAPTVAAMLGVTLPTAERAPSPLVLAR